MTVLLKFRVIFTGVVCLLTSSVFVPAQASTRAVVIAGLGGNVEYNASFSEHSEAISTALRTRTSEPEHVTYLIGDSATRESFLSAMNEVVKEANDLSDSADSVDTFVLIMIGHGNINRDGWQFNVSGPDISVTDLVAALAPLNVGREVIVASASASGELLKPLTQAGRTLVTATKSGGELNAVRFTQYWANAMASDEADVDRNELLTVKEAFTFANNATQQYYAEQKLLASEHARFASSDDSSTTIATLGALREARNNPAITALLDERSVLEKSFYAVKASKPTLTPVVYYTELEAVLVQIAKLQQTIDSAISESQSESDSNAESSSQPELDSTNSYSIDSESVE